MNKALCAKGNSSLRKGLPLSNLLIVHKFLLISQEESIRKAARSTTVCHINLNIVFYSWKLYIHQ